jgi:hypothetical protein|tara:strand:- start:5277 stop:6194 length:918 start_codon:yes stop_codon:yes gene_type:complete
VLAKSSEVSVFLRGGLGNQLFQYSAGLKISRMTGKKLILRTDLLPIQEDKIGGISRWPNQISEFSHLGYIETRGNQPPGKTNNLGKFMQLMRMLGDHAPGLLQNCGVLANENRGGREPSSWEKVSLINSYCSFKASALEDRDLLSEQILGVNNPSSDYLITREQIMNVKPIVVHLRLGDYLGLQGTYGALSMKYLEQGLDVLSEKTRRAERWIFSDSPLEIPMDLLRIIRPSRLLGPSEIPRPIENLALMSSAAGLICSNSSFSWWGGFLMEDSKTVVAPYFSKASVNNFGPIDTNSGWEIIDVD